MYNCTHDGFLQTDSANFLQAILLWSSFLSKYMLFLKYMHIGIMDACSFLYLCNQNLHCTWHLTDGVFTAYHNHILCILQHDTSLTECLLPTTIIYTMYIATWHLTDGVFTAYHNHILCILQNDSSLTECFLLTTIIYTMYIATWHLTDGVFTAYHNHMLCIFQSPITLINWIIFPKYWYLAIHLLSSGTLNLRTFHFRVTQIPSIPYK